MTCTEHQGVTNKSSPFSLEKKREGGAALPGETKVNGFLGGAGASTEP